MPIPTASGGTDYAPHWMVFDITPRGYAADIFIDKVMLVRGQQPLAYAPRPDEQDNYGGGQIVAVAVPDIGQISGTQGGWRLANGGGLIQPF